MTEREMKAMEENKQLKSEIRILKEHYFLTKVSDSLFDALRGMIKRG